MRLYEINCNEEQWSIQGNRNSGYKLVNKKDFSSYSISGDVIGIEQISDDEFLVYRSFMRDLWQILRLQLRNRQSIVKYKNNFLHFCFLTDDIIIFDYKDNCHGGKLYSISKNDEIDDLNHLISGSVDRHDASYVLDRTITLLYEKQDDKYPTYLLMDYKLHTYQTNEHLQLILCPNSLKPITPVYSTLRDKYFTLTDSLTLKDLVEEENNYLYIIDDFLRKIYNTANTKSVEELISMIQKND